MVIHRRSSLVLFCIACLRQPSTAAASLQTPWQKALFKNVSERAAELSQAAIPALLERLDSAAFRKEKLQAEAKVAEVVSGFPGVATAKDILPDQPVMSIADGLRGSFFPNSWQGVFLDAPNPRDVFDNGARRHLVVVHHQGEATVQLDEWDSAGCRGTRVRSGSYVLNQCVHFEDPGVMMEFTANSTVVNQSVWLLRDNTVTSSGWPDLLFKNGSNVTCPTSPPIQILSLIADGQCHSYAIGPRNGWKMEDNAEMSSYGLKPFAKVGSPASLEEAAERGPYAVVNQLLYDQGSPLFGDVSAVFSFKAVQETAVISAIDTGFYQLICKGQGNPTHLEWIRHNCSTYVAFEQLGTAQHFNHLFLINDNFWLGPSALAKRFARLEGEWGSHLVSSPELLNYWEALPAATLQYPSDVRFLIGSFPSFFGSATGLKLQQWAKQRRWVLVWSLGPNVPIESRFFTQLLSMNLTFALNRRLLDPDVVRNTTASKALGLNESILEQFQRSWSEVEKLRNTSSKISSAMWVEQWQKVQLSLPKKLQMRPLAAGLCSRPQDAPECVGVNGDGDCVCYEHEAPLQSSHTELII